MKTVSLVDFEAKAGDYIRACEEGPILVVQNGMPSVVLLPIKDDAEAERLAMAYSTELEGILNKSKRQIREGDRILHDDFWRTLDEEGDQTPGFDPIP